MADGILEKVEFGKKGFHLDDRLKELMQDLGNAINESLSDSDRIAQAIGEIKKSGYDVFLVLEATIGFNKRDEDDDVPEIAGELSASHPEKVRGRAGKSSTPAETSGLAMSTTASQP